ncbi:MAG: S41 family peptidase [Panacagrimonas sp.]
MGVFAPSQDFEAMCRNPRSGIDPATGQAFRDVRGTSAHENNWLRSWTRELYLWYDEVPDLDPAAFGTPEYFDLLKTPAILPSGRPKDQFHFTSPTAEFVARTQSGVQLGYGAAWIILSQFPPRRVVVAYTEPNSPAAAAGLARGDEVLAADGVDFVNARDSDSIDALNRIFFPSAPGRRQGFTIRDTSGNLREVSMTSANVTTDPVQNVTTLDNGTVGYLLFNEHIATAESELIDAVETLAAQGVSDLILDVRYNGGGSLGIASELAFMIAGSGSTSGKTFERQEFNDRNRTIHPFTGQPLTPLPFLSGSQGFSVAPGQALPSLNLSRVFVLTGPGSCSATEAVINGLRGVDVEVIQIGSKTCGKPYGFFPADNCGTTYFSIQLQGFNAKDFGDYADGFAPLDAAGSAAVLLPGCAVADDFAHPLGDPEEGQLAAALGYRANGTCTAPFQTASKRAAGPAVASEGRMLRPPWTENRILER